MGTSLRSSQQPAWDGYLTTLPGWQIYRGFLCRVADGAADSEAGYDSEEEPSWELPDELQEYDGDPADRKTMVAFRQAQQVWPSSQAVSEVEDRGISMSWLCEAFLPNGLCSYCHYVDCVAPLRVPALPNNTQASTSGPLAYTP